MEEIWKDIYFIENGVIWDYRGLYQVSNLGRIKSLKRTYYSGTNNKVKKTKEETISKQTIRSGYLIARFCKDGKTKNFQSHRLVAHMFIDGYFDGAEVDHIDTNTLNNRADNLRWVTRKENQNNDLTRKHNSETRKGKYCGERNPNSKCVIQKDLNENIVKIWRCAKEICNEYNWNYNTFYAHLSGNLKCKNPHEYKGFIWIFYNDNDK